MYGLSEVGGRFCVNLIKNNKYKFFVGKPLDYMRIVNKNNRKGEIKIKSDNLYIGYYQKNNFGIRIENLIYVKKNGNKIFFENLTMAPIDKELIDKALLNEKEKKWLNDYHSRVF